MCEQRSCVVLRDRQCGLATGNSSARPRYILEGLGLVSIHSISSAKVIVELPLWTRTSSIKFTNAGAVA
jgi:hypothetical protein